MRVAENYGFADSAGNRMLEQGEGWVRYENEHIECRKSVEMREHCLIVRQAIKWQTVQGRNSDLILRIRFHRPFDYYYSAYGFSSPKILGRFIPRGEMPEIKEAYRGACTNSTKYCLFVGRKASVMIDRLMANGYVVYGNPSRVSGDLATATYPMFGWWGLAGWNPGQTDPVSTFRKNRYSEEGGTIEYRFHFFDTGVKEEAQTLAADAYYGQRKEALAERYYPDYESICRPPRKKIAFTALVAANWAGGVRKAMGSWTAKLKEMRGILDDAGLSDHQMYFWLMLWDGKRAGWGHFPPDTQVVHDFYSMVRRIPNVRLGLYVNYWAASVESTVYKDHPEYFSSRRVNCDGGDKGFMGKLPEWGEFMAREVPKVVEAYGLDFVFFDNAGFSELGRGTIPQNQHYARSLATAVHRAGAFTIANGDCPYWDYNYREFRAGDSEVQDREVTGHFQRWHFKKVILTPEFHPLGTMIRARGHEPSHWIHVTGRALLKSYADRPQFVPRFPVHFGGSLHRTMIDQYFKPYVRKLAQRRANARGTTR